jgi:hypothetical protein
LLLLDSLIDSLEITGVIVLWFRSMSAPAMME